MHSTLALAAMAAAVYAAPAPVPQGVSETLAPSAPAPAGCSASYTGKFQIAAVNVTTTSKRDIESRQAACGSSGSLTLDLAGGKLTDGLSRTGYIASNYQFQFDAPPQAGTIYNAGWSSCSNGTLALGGSTIFYQCLSGEFYNLYDRHWAAQCNAVYLQILPCSSGGTGGSGGGSAPGGVGQIPDGQPTATGAGGPVTQIGDGQIQVPTGKPISQISDGQIQVPTGKPISQISDGQIQVPTGKPISQISDGQIQVPTGKPISQISDGQIQAPTGTPTPTQAPVTQIGDGQIQAPTGHPAPVTQISDGQIQAPTSTPKAVAPITQISDGQIQAPTHSSTVSAKSPVVTQIGDGQIQAPANATSSILPFTGGAAGVGASSGIAAFVIGVLSMLFL